MGLIVLVLLVMDFNRRMAERQQQDVRLKQIAVQATDQMATQEALETQIAEATSPDPVIGDALGDGEGREGDTIVILMTPTGDIPPPTPAPQESAPRVSNWTVWMAWLFGYVP